MTYGLKIAKPGKSVHSTDLRDLSVDLNTFSMFKLHSSSTSSVTINADEKEKSSSISHGLGYVPAFLVYYKRQGESVERLLPDIPYGVDFDFYPWAYATSSNIVVGYSFKDPYNRQIIGVADAYNTFWGDSDFFLGRYGSSGNNSAVRFTGVNIASGDTVTRAKVYLYAGNSGGSSSQHIKWDNYGVKETNTSACNSGVFGRTKTTATSYQDRTVPNLGDYVEVDAVSMVNEIKGQGGWSSGNAMGFTFLERGSDNDSWFSDSSPLYATMELTKSGSFTVQFRVIIFKDKIAD